MQHLRSSHCHRAVGCHTHPIQLTNIRWYHIRYAAPYSSIWVNSGKASRCHHINMDHWSKTARELQTGQT